MVFSMFRLSLIATSVALLITGCSYKIAEKGGLEAHKNAPLVQSKFMPTREQMESNKTRVVVFEPQNKHPKAKSAGAGSAAVGEIEKYVLESGNVEIVDRDAAKKLQNEIALIEMDGSKEIKGPILADYAIMGDITSASSKSIFWAEGKPGKMLLAAVGSQLLGRDIKNPPEYEYIADVKGKLKIFQLPDARLIKTFDLNDNKSLTKTAGLAIGNISIANRTPPALGINEENSLITGATIDAVESIRHDLKNFFTKKGYVVEKRVSQDGKNFIFLVTFGSQDGAKEGEELEIYTLDERTSALGKVNIDENIIGKAKIADIIKSDECWIHLDNKEIADKIKMGDYVKIKFSKGAGDYAKSVGKFMF